MHLVGAITPGADLGNMHMHRFVGELVRDIAKAHDHGEGTLIERTEHALR